MFVAHACTHKSMHSRCIVYRIVLTLSILNHNVVVKELQKTATALTY